LLNLANSIAISTNIDAANVLVVSPTLATVLQSAGPIFSRTVSAVNATTVTPEVGTLNGTIKVYRDRYARENEALLAYKGAGINDAGVIYCPFITGVVNRGIDPNDFSTRIGVMSRYAFCNNMLGAENYYRLAKFNGLDRLLAGGNLDVPSNQF
jgi:hypothetical protein